jgi:hypothetical protein
VERIFAPLENFGQFWADEFLVLQSPLQLNGLSIPNLSSQITFGNVANTAPPLGNHIRGHLPSQSKHINSIKIEQMR